MCHFSIQKIDTWRENFKGVQHLHEATSLLLTGAVDDVWVDDQETLYVVDYKSTSTTKEISLDDPWKHAYKRQMEIYQWLLRRNGFTVSDTGYFVYVNANTALDGFDGRLEFAMQIIAYCGDDAWVEDAIIRAHQCLREEVIPAPTATCEWCAYRDAAQRTQD